MKRSLKKGSFVNARNAAKVVKENRTVSNDVGKSIVKTYLARSVAGLKEWQNAAQQAESTLSPNNTELVKVYKDIEIDAHLWALMRTIQLKVIGTKFFVYKSNEADAEVDEISTNKLLSKWFRKLCIYAIDADFHGFSLVQMGDIVNENFVGCDLIPREYVIQQRGGVKRKISDKDNLIPFDEGDFINWLIPIGERNNLGLLHKAAPLIIKKKEVISAWSEAAELFGMPTRIGRTNISSPKHRENMEDMLENMGSAAWGVFDKDDDIQLIEGGKSDFFKIYDEFINRVNSEISKLILLQTGTTDEKAFVGSANVHADILGDVIKAYTLLVQDMANEQLIPLCVRQNILPAGCYLKANDEQKFSPKELFDIVKELLKFYDLPLDWINENFDVPVEAKATPAAAVAKTLTDPKANAKSVMKAVKNLYSGVLKTVENE
jgi:phage gp29-like protein